MAKLTLNDISAGYKSTSTINANNAATEAAMENTLSRDGTAPNTMSVDLDMNSNQVSNLPTPVADNDAANKGYVDDSITNSVEGQIDGSFNVGTSWDWTARQDFQAGFRVEDSGATDYVSFTHDGTDLNLIGVNTTDINIQDGMVLKIFDADESDNVAIWHDGNDAQYGGIDVGRFHDFVESDGTPGQITAKSIGFDASVEAGPGVRWGNSAGDDTVSMTVTGDSITWAPNTGVMSTVSLGTGTFPLHLDGTDVSTLRDFTGLRLREVADHPVAPTAGYGALWAKDDAGSPLVYTTDTGVDTYIAPQIKVKTADQTIASDVVNDDDNHFTGYLVEAPGYYAIEGHFLVDDIGAGGFRAAFSYTIAPTTRSYTMTYVDNAGNSDEDTDVSGVDLEIEAASVPAEGRGAIHVSGHVYFGGSGSGTGKMTWAQESSNASGVTLKQGSWLKFTRIQ